MCVLLSFYGVSQNTVNEKTLRHEAAIMKTTEKISLRKYVLQAEERSRKGLESDTIVIPFFAENRVNVDCKSVQVRGGIPVSKGVLFKDYTFRVVGNKGENVPAQIDIRAFWPDGSVKWLLVDFDAALQALSTSNFFLQAFKKNTGSQTKRIAVNETQNLITVNTGIVEFSINKSGNEIFNTVFLLNNGERTPVVKPNNGSELFAETEGIETEVSGKVKYKSTGENRQVVLEEHGTDRVIILVKGFLVSEQNTRFAPYTLRIYSHSGSGKIGLSHSFVYNGNPNKEFLKSLGFKIHTALEKVTSFAVSEENALAHQIEYNPGNNLPEWSKLQLSQNGSLGFTVKKWIDAEKNSAVKMKEGKRSLGWGNIVSSGVSVTTGLKNFWQEYPKALSVDAKKQELTVYFYSPFGEKLDLRRYSDYTYSDLYETTFNDLKGVVPAQPSEGWEDFIATEDIGARYIGKTSEFFMDFSAETSWQNSARKSLVFQEPPILSTSPEWVAKTRVFGDFMPLSATFKNQMGNPLEETIDFLVNEPEHRNWYSFLDYGDMVHSYDAGRDVWRKDEGGYAWNNNEHCICEGLWYAYLHSGNAELFKVAEAMTRHLNDVDMYHDGPLAGNGTRHNVNHFGCVCKKRRMTLPENKRIYYYLTGDEHSRDMIHFVYNSFFENQTDAELNKDGRNTMDLAVFASAALFMWETTGNPKFGDLLKNTTETLCQFRINQRGIPRFVKFDPETGKGSPANDNLALQKRNFLLKFGPMDMLLNSVELTQSQKVHQAILEWAELTNLPDSLARKYQDNYSPAMDYGRTLTYAYKFTSHEPYLAKLKTWTSNHEVWFEVVGGNGVLDSPLHKIPRNGQRGSTHEQAKNEKFQLRGMADLLRNAPFCYFVFFETK